MTIKQHGGVFGRNPSFNDVEVESLSIAGDAVPDASTILVDGDIGTTVQGYDADTAKLDLAQTFTDAQQIDKASAAVLIANRTTDDGDVVVFKKDNAQVGSIGSRGTGTSYIILKSTTDAGAGLTGSDNRILPMDESALADDNTDLGMSSYRFKDLYLSGGTYLGGTAAANRLSKYEEGTWTPVVYGSTSAGTASYSVQNGNYTKVGNLVYAAGRVSFSGHTGTGNMRMSGLPFTSTATNTLQPPFTIHGSDIALTASNYMVGTVRHNDTYVEIIQTPVGGGAQSAVPVDAAGSMFFTIIYQAA